MGLTHLDAGVIIGFLDADDLHHEAATEVLSDALKQNDRLCIAASALTECLVGPARRGSQQIDVVRALLQRLPVSVVDIGTEAAVRAAVIRAQHKKLRTPDALVIATAETSSAQRLITTDHQWPAAESMGLNVVIERI